MQTSTAAHPRASHVPGDHSVSVFLLGALAGLLVGALAAAPAAPAPLPRGCVQMEPLVVEVP